MPKPQLSPREYRENLALIDSNIRRGKELVEWHCERCQKKLYYPANALTPQCPHCSTFGVMTRMKRYYGGLTVISGGV